jgi:hypothetical protein
MSKRIRAHQTKRSLEQPDAFELAGRPSAALPPKCKISWTSNFQWVFIVLISKEQVSIEKYLVHLLLELRQVIVHLPDFYEGANEMNNDPF